MILPIAINPIDFSTILPFWQSLWPGRQSSIMPVSTMLYQGGYDMAIRANYTDRAVFLGAFSDSQLIGVFSGHPTTATQYRCRGLYVLPEFHHRAVGRRLVQAILATAPPGMAWALPRVENKLLFQNCGFVQMSQPITEGVEFGPNLYMAQVIQ